MLKQIRRQLAAVEEIVATLVKHFGVDYWTKRI